jgi:serine protease Do
MIKPNFSPKLSFGCGLMVLTISLISYTSASKSAIARSIDSTDSLSSSIESRLDRSLKIAVMTEEETRIKLFEKTKNAVVKIITAEGTGSGFIFSSDGLVVTNAHVVKAEDGTIPAQVKVELADGTTLTSEVLGTSKTQDLALIKIPNQTKLQTLPLAPKNSIQTGQNVYAIGAPYGRENVFTTGTLNKIDTSSALLLHDARINPGNSGGPLINSKGQVIGVNVSIYHGGNSGQGIGQAIPVDKLQIFLNAYKGRLTDFVSLKNPKQPQAASEISTDGRAISAKFQASDETDDRNIHYHRYSFQAEAGKTLTIEMTSQKVDPTLVLYYLGTGDKKELEKITANYDISPTNTNARILGTVSTSGIYVIEAKTFQPGETGEYQIKAKID